MAAQLYRRTELKLSEVSLGMLPLLAACAPDDTALLADPGRP